MAGLKVSKKEKKRQALKPLTSDHTNISARKNSFPLAADKENNGNGSLSLLLSAKKNTHRTDLKEQSYVQELNELQGRIEKLSLEKEAREGLLKERDELIRQKDEELENRCKEMQKLQQELKKLHKSKAFNPTMSIPQLKSLEKNEETKCGAEKKMMKMKKMKKPSPPYILWSKNHWNEVKMENPDSDFKEISNIMGAKWKILSAEEKEKYEQRYQQEKEAYLIAVGKEKRENEAMKLLEEEQKKKTAMELLEQYLQFRQEADKNGKKLRKEKDPSKPKRPTSAFFLYLKEHQAALLGGNKNIFEVAKIAGEEWKNMNEEQRTPYVEIGRKLKEEYDREMEIYRRKKKEEVEKLENEVEEHTKILKQEALQLLKKKEKTESILKKAKEIRKKQKEEKTLDPNKPKKPASSFILFSREARKKLSEERQGISNSTLNSIVSVKWKELSSAEKQVWIEEAAKAMAAYKKEMEEYKKDGAGGTSKICLPITG